VDPRFSVTPVSERVQRVYFTDDHPMHGGGVANYLVGGGAAVALIDTGTGEPAHMASLLEFLEQQGRRLTEVFLTHGHGDHINGVPQLIEGTDATVHAHPAMEGRLSGWVPAGRLHWLEDGGVCTAGDAVLQTVAIPGHTADSVAFRLEEEAVGFTGDTILGEGSTSVVDLVAYMASLQKLKGYEWSLLCPGHGPLIDRPARKIQDYIRHRSMRDREVMNAAVEPVTVDEILARIYPTIDPRIVFAARRNVESHLRKLVEEGRVAVVDEREGEPLYRKVVG
jgi:glyoxylase-like metal-dependent hydrolase (beta-lactamase superfamily II)